MNLFLNQRKEKSMNKEKRDKGKNPLTRKKELFSSEKQGEPPSSFV